MANIQEVARRAGVSISTVSRVLNGTARVNNKLTERVLLAIEELGYRPSRAARSLRANYSTIIGLLISDIQNIFFMDLIKGVEDVALRNGYSVLLCNSDEDSQREQRYLEILYDERVAGLIVVPTREKLNGLELFRERNIPIVAVDRRIKSKNIDAVLVDNVRGAREAVTHLITNGYQRIGTILGPKTLSTGYERLVGYRQALEEAGIAHDPALEKFGSFKEESGRQATNELLALHPRIDALFVGNNTMTIGALDALHHHGLRVPDDIALIGYDAMPWTALRSISLTMVTQPVYELGATAALRLFQRLQNPSEQTQQEIILTPTLSILDSSAPSKQPTITLSSVKENT
ncbi:LacI family DNA-binding transcriptional regulator [Dictyobacter kobayashii]|uniref:LacI family transcriptional regulator n=1 Tax=Dictyobacter kobayashii TaxID=2014872 RepID=A0A402ASA8_9CHLR|nr:LacI family DNA-binding transcriptional regulator [Dictyobacter kobayashii]GCE21979.1 LacI family transcriptional regulator [Dictyobacter kobayashii]